MDTPWFDAFIVPTLVHEFGPVSAHRPRMPIEEKKSTRDVVQRFARTSDTIGRVHVRPGIGSRDGVSVSLAADGMFPAS
jgi:hypothetical protein